MSTQKEMTHLQHWQTFCLWTKHFLTRTTFISMNHSCLHHIWPHLLISEFLSIPLYYTSDSFKFLHVSCFKLMLCSVVYSISVEACYWFPNRIDCQLTVFFSVQVTAVCCYRWLVWYPALCSLSSWAVHIVQRLWRPWTWSSVIQTAPGQKGTWCTSSPMEWNSNPAARPIIKYRRRATDWRSIGKTSGTDWYA